MVLVKNFGFDLIAASHITTWFSSRIMPTFLMSKPTYFALTEPINPWMGLRGGLNLDLAHQQWTHAKEQLEQVGATILEISPGKNLQDMTFCADSGVVFNNTFLRATYKFPARTPEQALFEQWLSEKGYCVVSAPQFFEGGDVVRTGNTIVCGYGHRTNLAGVSALRKTFPELRLIGPLKLINPWFYHLDTCFAMPQEDTAVYYPAAFAPEAQAIIQESFARVIEVNQQNALNFALNMVIVGKKIFLTNCTPAFTERMHSLGFTVVLLHLTEFMKSGGSIKCLTLRLKD